MPQIIATFTPEQSHEMLQVVPFCPGRFQNERWGCAPLLPGGRCRLDRLPMHIYAHALSTSDGPALDEWSPHRYTQ